MATNQIFRVGTVQELSLRAFVWRHKKSGITFWWEPEGECWCWTKRGDGSPDGWCKDLASMPRLIRKTFNESVILS